MEIVGILAQIGAGLWILNVWILRFNKETEFRGGDAINMLEEFHETGLVDHMPGPGKKLDKPAQKELTNSTFGNLFEEA